MNKSTCIIVLGGHRTGTSLVAGICQKLGVSMGEKLLGADRYNTKGHFEDVAFLRLHKRIVGDWKRPMVDFEPTRNAYIELIRRREYKHELWGIKDPRMCYVLPHFLEIVEADVRIISTRRSLEASAQSLARRKGKTASAKRNIEVNYKRAVKIARAYEGAKRQAIEKYRYYSNAGRFSDELLEVSYNDILAHPNKEVRRIAEFCGVPFLPRAAKFVTPNMRHFK